MALPQLSYFQEQRQKFQETGMMITKNNSFGCYLRNGKKKLHGREIYFVCSEECHCPSSSDSKTDMVTPCEEVADTRHNNTRFILVTGIRIIIHINSSQPQPPYL